MIMGKRSKTIKNKRKIKVLNYKNRAKEISELKKSVSKSFFREINFTLISIFVVIIVMITGAYAVLSSVQKSTAYNTITVGQLKVDFVNSGNNLGNIINLNGAYPSTDATGQSGTPYSFKISNMGNINASYKIKILDDTDMITEDGCSTNLLGKNRVKISINKGTPFLLSERENNEYIVEEGKISEGKERNYDIRIWIDERSGNEVLGKHFHGKIVVESTNVKAINENIQGAYLYSTASDKYCVAGGETSCEETTCYKNRNANSCSPGTIIKYKVSSDTTKYFYVISDNGTTMVLQDKLNTISGISWNTTGSNNDGPTNALPSLETVVTSWSNVNNQTYALGTTTFNGNYYTGCSNSSCDTNKYTLLERTGKARLLTIQEALALGCPSSCPEFLKGSSAYWLINADSSSNTNAWVINTSNSFTSQSVTSDASIKAVIEIDK